MLPADRLTQITERFEFLEARLNAGPAADEIAGISREYSDLKPVVDQIVAYRRILSDIEEATAMLEDPDMAELAEEELPRLRKALPPAERALQLALLPKDAADARPAMIEIRPGTGGDEAALFAGDLLRMYERYADARGWQLEIIEQQLTELGGIKEVVAHVTGEGVFARLKYESGVHRVSCARGFTILNARKWPMNVPPTARRRWAPATGLNASARTIFRKAASPIIGST